MLQINKQNIVLVGPSGSITVPKEDEITSKIAMLYEGQCESLGPTRAARKYGFSKQRYFQLLHLYSQHGALSLQNRTHQKIDTHRTKKRCKAEPCDTVSIEHGIRQLLANKVTGTMVGI